MKYCILITGKNQALINELFTHLGPGFECLSCSTRYKDLLNHLNHFTPDALVYCYGQETMEELRQFTMLKETLDATHVPVVVLSSPLEYDSFNRGTFGMADRNLEKTSSVSGISAKLTTYMEEFQEKKEERRQVEKEREEAKLLKKEEQKLKREKNAEKIKLITGKDMSSKVIDNELNELISEMGDVLPSDGSGGTSVSAESIDDAELSELLGMAEMLSDHSKDRKHILVIDDDPLMLKSIKNQLQENYDVATAINGKIALKFLSSKHTDLILLDYEMPVETGPDILKKIRDNSNAKDIPVIFLTGIMERDKIEKALSLKPQGYLLKPVDHTKLLETIQNFL